MSDVVFKDNSKVVLALMSANEAKALNAIGQVAVEITTDYMQNKYSAPIYQTGDLIRDVNYKVDAAAKNVKIGNSLNYGPWVHEGTARMKGRPYLRDAVADNGQVYQEVADEYLSKGF